MTYFGYIFLENEAPAELPKRPRAEVFCFPFFSSQNQTQPPQATPQTQPTQPTQPNQPNQHTQPTP